MAKQTVKPPKHTANASVRIIGGQHKRRLVQFLDIDGLRPTPDRLRETLFNWLTGYLGDANVLDMCAGSGVLGFESLSRGASTVTFIEFHPQQAKQLSITADTLKLGLQCRILTGDARHILPTLTTAFDVVFIDPPYALNLWQELLDKLITHQLIHADTLIYIESDKPISDIITTPLTIIKDGKVGQVFAYLCQMA